MDMICAQIAGIIAWIWLVIEYNSLVMSYNGIVFCSPMEIEEFNIFFAWSVLIAAAKTAFDEHKKISFHLFVNMHFFFLQTVLGTRMQKNMRQMEHLTGI